MDAICSVVPEDFRLDLDFNATLLDAEHAIPILQTLETKYANFGICEGPINDVEGNKKLRAAVKVPIVLHATVDRSVLARRGEILLQFGESTLERRPGRQYARFHRGRDDPGGAQGWLGTLCC